MRVFLLGLCASLVPVGTLAQQLPSDIELRAAYCTRILKMDAELYRGGAVAYGKAIQEVENSPPQPGDAKLKENLREGLNGAQRDIQNAQSELDRVNSYLLPRLSYLDATAILGALHRADADITASRQMNCSAECQKDLACAQRECVRHDIVARFRVCRDLSWLPF